jgi:predicted nucleotidyltransferase
MLAIGQRRYLMVGRRAGRAIGALVRREEAVRRLEAVLERLAGASSEPLSMVTELYAFGSFARGALVVGDIDIDVEYERNHERAMREVRLQMYGRNPHADLSRALFQGQRVFHPQFSAKRELDEEVGPQVLLWRRGDMLDESLARLRALQPDPTAARAERDPVAAELVGLDRWVVRAPPHSPNRSGRGRHHLVAVLRTAGRSTVFEHNMALDRGPLE